MEHEPPRGPRRRSATCGAWSRSSRVACSSARRTCRSRSWPATSGHGAGDEFDLAFDFELLLSPWEHRHLALAIERAEALHPPGAWPTFAISNHDQPRHATRWGAERTRAAAFLLLTLRGVAVLYAGEEIGMADADASATASTRPSIVPAATAPARRCSGMSPTGGFTTGTPWLPRRRPGDAQRGRPVRRSGLPPVPLPPPRSRPGAQCRRWGVGRIGPSSMSPPTCWPGCASSTASVSSCCSTSATSARTCALSRFAGEGAVVVGTDHTRSGHLALDGLTLGPLEGLALRL